MKRKYKIALDDLGYYNVYYSFWFLPFWIKSNSWLSSFRSIDDAKDYINKLKKPVYVD